MRSSYDSRVPRGATLAELLAALSITGLLAAVLIGTLIAQLRLARVASQRALETDALRTASAVLDGEVRRAMPADVRAFAADSIAIRAFRGLALPCTVTADRVTVRYRGDRAPDASKDSVFVLAVSGAGSTSALSASRPAAASGCDPQPGEAVLEWRLTPAPPSAAALLVFESGQYYLSGRALRYRLGGEGRQPLTAEAFRHPQTRFPAGPSARGVRFDLATDAGRLYRREAVFAPPPRPAHE